MPVLLFDIDGTLVRTGGAGKVAMESALRQAFGVTTIYDTVPYSGRTDRSIAKELLEVHSVEPTVENQHRLTNTYLDLLPNILAETQAGEICPGIPEILLECQQQDSIKLGLLTGNVRRGARIKLGHYDLWKFFSDSDMALGGFGDHHYDRDDVAREAWQAVIKKHSIAAEDVWIIGDTPLDVQCARAIGAKVIAVSTGWHSMDELRASKPDALTDDLRNLGDVLAWF